MKSFFLLLVIFILLLPSVLSIGCTCSPNNEGTLCINPVGCDPGDDPSCETTFEGGQIQCGCLCSGGSGGTCDDPTEPDCDIDQCQYMGEADDEWMFNWCEAPINECDNSDFDLSNGFCCGDDEEGFLIIPVAGPNAGVEACCIDVSDTCWWGEAQIVCNDGTGQEGEPGYGDCKDGFDNDCDEHIDCEESECDGLSGNDGNDLCELEVEKTCNDDFDNDADELIDCEDTDDCCDDPSCADDSSCSEPQPTPDEVYGWEVNEATSTISVVNDPHCHSDLCVEFQKTAGSFPTIKQEIGDLDPGTYELSAWVVGTGATLELFESGDLSNWISIASEEDDEQQLSVQLTIASPDIIVRLSVPSAYTGLFYFDDIQLIKVHDQYTPPVGYIDNFYPYGCCEEGSCWDGNRCVDTVNMTFAFETPIANCVGGDDGSFWDIGYESQAEAEDEFGYCVDDGMCFNEDEGQDVPMWCAYGDEYDGEIYCHDDFPTSKTALIAANILKLAEDEHIDEYQFLCDNQQFFDNQVGSFTQEIDNQKYVVTCLLYSADGWIAGSIVDHAWFDYDNNPCNGDYRDDTSKKLPECFFDLVLGIGPGDDPEGSNELYVDFDDDPATFTNGRLWNQDFNGNLVNNHRIKSAGWSKRYNILIFSDLDINYQTALGETVEYLTLFNRFPTLKDWTNSPDDIPDELMLIETGSYPRENIYTSLTNTNLFDTLFKVESDSKYIEAVVESYDKEFMYQMIHYEGVNAGDVCTLYHDLYKQQYSIPENWLSHFFMCNLFGGPSTYTFDILGRFRTWDERPLYDDQYKKKVIHDTWNNMTEDVRQLSYCMFNVKDFDFVSLPEQAAIDAFPNASVIFNHPKGEGCCLKSHCWDGFDCVDSGIDEEFNDGQGEPVQYVCKDGEWTTDIKWDWNHNITFYCPEESQCFCPHPLFEEQADAENYEGYINNQSYIDHNDEYNDCLPPDEVSWPCVESGYWIDSEGNNMVNDHVCIGGNSGSTWTTRTALTAEVLRRTQGLDAGQYVIHCDLTEQAVPEMLETIQADTVDKICVLRYRLGDTPANDPDRVAFGFAIKDTVRGAELSNLIRAISGEDYEDACNGIGVDGLEACDTVFASDPEFWYDGKLQLLFFDKEGIQLEESAWIHFKQFLKNPFTFIIRWINSLFEPVEPHEVPENFDRYYDMIIDGRAAKASIQTIGDIPPAADAWYGGPFPDMTISTAEHSDIDGILRETDPQHIFITSEGAGPIADYWPYLTTRLRIQPGAEGEAPEPPINP
ncbi:MAG: hypothetical protein ABIH34_04470 [Nanoarchaeota archaeon]